MKNIPNFIAAFRAGIALGSNLGDSLYHLQRAAAALLELSTAPSLCSCVYRTVPVDCPPGSPHFLNAVVEIEWKSSPMGLWLELQRLEVLAGRQRPHSLHAPRPLDLDLLYLGLYRGVFDSITLPHPQMGSRRFVLAPLSDFAPHLLLPMEERTVLEQLHSLPNSPAVERIRQSLTNK